MKNIVAIVLLVVVIASITVIALYYPYLQAQPFSLEQACLNAGGAVVTRLCCKSVSDFPDTCSIGACGCSLENSHEVKVCDCGERCWDSKNNNCI